MLLETVVGRDRLTEPSTQAAHCEKNSMADPPLFPPESLIGERKRIPASEFGKRRLISVRFSAY
jgi:hypothetical protein